ncbi:MAG: methyltransferase domain-containing protein [Bacteroidales bacterium]|nr:methyltransferase domain-containing protein [Bacteroidales bacterium]
MAVLDKFVEKYCEFPKALRRPMWHVWHKLLIKYDKDARVNFMNYGYHSLNGDKPVILKKEDETNRYCIQLYDHVVNKADLANTDVLEVGSGRGGGASYIARYYKPRTYTGLDMSGSLIDFCNRHYKTPGLSFVKGVAENPPFDNHSFDVIVNVESARCYRSLEVFFNEVHRLLRPGGHFLFADMIDKGEVEDMHDKLKSCGFEIIENKNITKNIAHALDNDSERRESLIQEKVPGFLKNSFAQFAGTKGTERYHSFTNGKFEYWSYRLKKMEN